ncbi:hypothetical protein M413DRAFT_35741, partial [Hebeloma cylindrosporum]
VYRLRLPDNYPGKSPEYEVERIVGHKRVGVKRLLRYLVRWVGYGPQFDLWLSDRDLRNSPALLREY